MSKTMHAVQLLGYGGLDQLVYRSDVPVPTVGPGDVLVRVVAAGMNNTDINTRTGWYKPTVASGTTATGGAEGFGVVDGGMGNWSDDVSFPRIQGADCAGIIHNVGDDVDKGRIGQSIICDPYLLDPDDVSALDSARFLGADLDGAFAQYVAIPAANAIDVPDETGLSHTQLATVPCSGGTAMNMLLMADVKQGDRMLVTGASGGVGSFLVQLGKWLGAEVIAVCSRHKRGDVMALGADAIVDRDNADFINHCEAAGSGGRYSVVADVVGGDRFVPCLDLLRRGGRYVTAGAIAGPLVELDLRTLYLKNLAFFGSTVFRRDAMPVLMQALASGEVIPAVGATYPLDCIREAQEAFLAKHHVGSLVLLPPPVESESP